MGTPLKPISTFLSPRNISKLSPKYLSLPRNKPVSNKLTALPGNKRGTARNLFPDAGVSTFLSPIKITVNNFEFAEHKYLVNKDVLINTPTKLELLKNGLEKTKIQHILGKGTFGTVFRGTHKGQTVAVKLVKRKNALKEKHALHLNHDNIIKVLEVIESSNSTFSLVLMEYLPNSKDLQFILENLEINIENMILPYAVDITRGIEFCHNNNILHLDLKPKNILVVNLSQCKICDFGNSLNLEKSAGYREQVYNYQGTVVYAAPEILSGKYPTTKCDIYSLGIIFWQLENRENPHSNMENVESIIYKVVKADLRPRCDVKERNNLSPIYKKCWSKNDLDRPEAEDILLHLKKF